MFINVDLQYRHENMHLLAVHSNGIVYINKLYFHIDVDIGSILNLNGLYHQGHDPLTIHSVHHMIRNEHRM